MRSKFPSCVVKMTGNSFGLASSNYQEIAETRFCRITSGMRFDSEKKMKNIRIAVTFLPMMVYLET